MRYVLDTHAAIWLAQDSPRLGRESRRALEKLSPADLAISDVTLSEFARLLRTPALRPLDEPLQIIEAFAVRFRVQPIAPWIADRAAAYDWEHRDPCDRHILATAEFLGLPLVTKDATITRFASARKIPVLW